VALAEGASAWASGFKIQGGGVVLGICRRRRDLRRDVVGQTVLRDLVGEHRGIVDCHLTPEGLTTRGVRR
jgi:hypothetical protein